MTPDPVSSSEGEAVRRNGLLGSARLVIENAISGVENLPQISGAEEYLRKDWLPFARGWLEAAPDGPAPESPQIDALVEAAREAVSELGLIGIPEPTGQRGDLHPDALLPHKDVRAIQNTTAALRQALNAIDSGGEARADG